jgi:hypothetical protein
MHEEKTQKILEAQAVAEERKRSKDRLKELEIIEKKKRADQRVKYLEQVRVSNAKRLQAMTEQLLKTRHDKELIMRRTSQQKEYQHML